MKEAHTTDALRSKFTDVTRAYDIEHKLVRLVIDNASNVTCAFKDLVVPGFVEYFTTTEEIEDDDIYNEHQVMEFDDGEILVEEASLSTVDLDIDEYFEADANSSTALRILCFACVMGSRQRQRRFAMLVAKPHQ